jgi:hypothetical protein
MGTGAVIIWIGRIEEGAGESDSVGISLRVNGAYASSPRGELSTSGHLVRVGI